MKAKKLNVIDVIALVLVLAVGIFVGSKLVGNSTGTTVAPEMMSVSYVVKAEGVDEGIYESVQKYIPSSLMASGTLYNGEIVAVTQEPYLVLSANGDWVEDPDHVNLFFSVEATIAKQGVLTTEIASQEVRIGRNTHILKTEYIEIPGCIIVDVTWET